MLMVPTWSAHGEDASADSCFRAASRYPRCFDARNSNYRGVIAHELARRVAATFVPYLGEMARAKREAVAKLRSKSKALWPWWNLEKGATMLSPGEVAASIVPTVPQRLHETQ